MSESTSSHVFQKCWLPLTSELKMNCKHQHLRKADFCFTNTRGVRNCKQESSHTASSCISEAFPTSHNFISIIFSVASLTFFTSPHMCMTYSTMLLPQARSALSCPHTLLHQCAHWNCAAQQQWKDIGTPSFQVQSTLVFSHRLWRSQCSSGLD